MVQSPGTLLQLKHGGCWHRDWKRITPNLTLHTVIVFSVLFWVLLFWHRISLLRLGWPGIHYVTQVSLELSILLSQPPESWDYRHLSLCPARILLFYYHIIVVPGDTLWYLQKCLQYIIVEFTPPSISFIPCSLKIVFKYYNSVSLSQCYQNYGSCISLYLLPWRCRLLVTNRG
jgi:hypothetical protein